VVQGDRAREREGYDASQPQFMVEDDAVLEYSFARSDVAQSDDDRGSTDLEERRDVPDMAERPGSLHDITGFDLGDELTVDVLESQPRATLVGQMPLEAGIHQQLRHLVGVDIEQVYRAIVVPIHRGSVDRTKRIARHGRDA
jgi:hypothetical protein